MSEEGQAETVQYLCTTIPHYTVTLVVHREKVKIRAVNGLLTLDVDQAAALDKLMLKRHDLKQNLRKIDNEIDPAAVARQQKILEARLRKGPAAVKGSVHSATNSREKLRQNDDQVRVIIPPTEPPKAPTEAAYREMPITGEKALPNELNTGKREPSLADKMAALRAKSAAGESGK